MMELDLRKEVILQNLLIIFSQKVLGNDITVFVNLSNKDLSS